MVWEESPMEQSPVEAETQAGRGGAGARGKGACSGLCGEAVSISQGE